MAERMSRARVSKMSAISRCERRVRARCQPRRGCWARMMRWAKTRLTT